MTAQVAGIKRDLHFGAGADQQDTGSAAVCIGEDVPAADGPVGGGIAGVIAAVKDRRVSGPTALRISCAGRLGLRDLLAETVMCSTRGSARAEPARSSNCCRCRHPQGLGALLAVCLDEAFDKLVDVARLG